MKVYHCSTHHDVLVSLMKGCACVALSVLSAATHTYGRAGRVAAHLPADALECVLKAVLCVSQVPIRVEHIKAVGQLQRSIRLLQGLQPGSQCCSKSQPRAPAHAQHMQPHIQEHMLTHQTMHCSGHLTLGQQRNAVLQHMLSYWSHHPSLDTASTCITVKQKHTTEGVFQLALVATTHPLAMHTSVHPSLAHTPVEAMLPQSRAALPGQALHVLVQHQHCSPLPLPAFWASRRSCRAQQGHCGAC